MTYLECLKNHEDLQKRSEKSKNKLVDVREEISKRLSKRRKDYSIFCCGSLGREDFGEYSDLDIFVLSEKSKDKRTRVSDIKLIYELISVNKELKFPEFSNDAMFLKILSLPEMKKSLGRPTDDEKNLFTSRMLMLLESKPLFNDKTYALQMEKIVSWYFRDDDPDQSSFKPVFLLNDILRFWRTLCLNYETVRNDDKKPFRKKNINLKFSRILTIFATILPIISKNECSKEYVLSLCKMTPLERLATGLDTIGDIKLRNGFENFLCQYEFFLNAKEGMLNKRSIEIEKKEKKIINKTAIKFSDFLYKCLRHPKICKEYRKYLIL